MKSTTKISIVLLVAMLVTMSGGGNALARDSMDLRFSGTFFSQLVRDKGYDPYSQNDWMSIGQVAAELEVMKNLYVGLGYAGGSQQSSLMSYACDTDLTVHEIPVQVRYRYRLFDWLEPYGVVAGAPVFANASVTQTSYSGIKADQFRMGMRASAGVGFEILIPRTVFNKGRFRAAGFTLGLSFELGYMYRLPMNFDKLNVDGAGGEDYDQLPQGRVPFGDLNPHGIYMGFGLDLHL